MITILTLPHTSAAIWGFEETSVSTAVEYRWKDSKKGAKHSAHRRSRRFFPFPLTSDVRATMLCAFGAVLQVESCENSSKVRIR